LDVKKEENYSGKIPLHKKQGLSVLGGCEVIVFHTFGDSLLLPKSLEKVVASFLTKQNRQPFRKLRETNF
jgi:hypothetical protein